MANTPLDHFRSGDLTVGVVGLGYVGLPLAVEIARSGLRVVGFDVDAETVEGINAGTATSRMSHRKSWPAFWPLDGWRPRPIWLGSASAMPSRSRCRLRFRRLRIRTSPS